MLPRCDWIWHGERGDGVFGKVKQKGYDADVQIEIISSAIDSLYEFFEDTKKGASEVGIEGISGMCVVV